MNSLLAHESRMKKSTVKVEEKAFQVKDESSFKGKMENSGNWGRGRGGFRGVRGRGNDSGRGRGHFNDFRQRKSQIQWHFLRNMVTKKQIIGLNRKMNNFK